MFDSYGIETSIDRFGAVGILNGGKGSGNFGHSGRPGMVGGSGDGAVSPNEDELSDIAKKSIEKAQKEEPEVTRTVGEALDDNNAKFVGLSHRLKGQESLERKIRTDASRSDSPKTLARLQRVANSINDNLRYTAILNDDSFKKSYDGIKNQLESQGYEFVKVKNTMGNTEGEYKGINTQVRNKNGYIFELQFHTKDSWDTKDALHKEYEIVRDPKYSVSERQVAKKKLAEGYKALKTPLDANDIESFNKLKK